MLSNICFCTFINSSALSILLLGSEACKLFCFLHALMAQDGVSSLHAVLSSSVVCRQSYGSLERPNIV